jgi:hypothetical protein
MADYDDEQLTFPLDKSRVEAVTRGLVDGSQYRAQFEAILNHGAKFVLKPSEREDDEIDFYIVAPRALVEQLGQETDDSGDAGLVTYVGTAKVIDLMPSQN